MSEQPPLEEAQGYDRFLAMGELELLGYVQTQLDAALLNAMSNSEVAEFSKATRALGVKGYRFNAKTHRYEKQRKIK
jgi:hypothetical protein